MGHRDAQLHTLLPFLQKVFMLLHCCCPLRIPEEMGEVPAGTKLTYSQWWPPGGWKDPGLTRFSHKIILVFMTMCLWWELLRGTSSAKRREIKIIVKSKTIKINPGLGREMHTFHPCLDMTHQYSPVHAAWGATPALPSLLLWPLPCSLTNHIKSQLYSYITFLHTAEHIMHNSSRTTIMLLLNNFLSANQDAIGLAFTSWPHGHTTQPLRNTTSFSSQHWCNK